MRLRPFSRESDSRRKLEISQTNPRTETHAILTKPLNGVNAQLLDLSSSEQEPPGTTFGRLTILVCVTLCVTVSAGVECAVAVSCIARRCCLCQQFRDRAVALHASLLSYLLQYLVSGST